MPASGYLTGDGSMCGPGERIAAAPGSRVACILTRRQAARGQGSLDAVSLHGQALRLCDGRAVLHELLLPLSRRDARLGPGPRRRAGRDRGAPASGGGGVRGVGTLCCAVKCCDVNTNCCEVATPVQEAPAESSDDRAASKSLSLRAMLACGGIVAEWFSCGGSLPPPQVALVTGLDFIETLPCLHESASPLRSAPDLPPPRVG